jgi:predicted Zn-dependent protease
VPFLHPLFLARRSAAPRIRLLALSLALACQAAPPAVHAQVNLPALGDSVSGDFNVGTERRLGDAIMRDIRRDPDYLEDPILDEYLASLWQPLLAAARQTRNVGPDLDERFAWETFLVRDRAVNAFALPGGYVGVHLGLIAITTSRDELASVLAHELSHVTQRHIARSLVNSQRQSLIGLAATILGVIAAGRSGSGDAANALVTGGQAAAIQNQLNFSRDMEREADRVGFGVLNEAHFAPWGMASMFEKLDSASRLNDGNGFPYLRTHPLTTARIGEARSRLGPAGVPPSAATSDLEHAVMQARARVLMDRRVESLRRLQGATGDNASLPLAERVSAWCASALASSALGDHARAQSAIQAALALVQQGAKSDARAERAVRLLHAQLLLDSGQAARLPEVLQRFADETSRPVMLLRAQAALATPSGADEKLRRSAAELQTRVAIAPRDAIAWQLLSQVHERLGHPLQAVRAAAESHYALGDLSGAADRLRAGQRMARSGTSTDFVEASVIDARLRDIETQRRELAAELRGEGRAAEDRLQ